MKRPVYGRCWLWEGFCDKDGYGRVSFGTKNSQLVHRVVYAALGYDLETDTLDHLCRVRNCYNPAHLEPVSRGENVRRGEGGRNMSEKTHCPQGHPYDEENTRWYRGRRYCRQCHRVQKRPVSTPESREKHAAYVRERRRKKKGQGTSESLKLSPIMEGMK